MAASSSGTPPLSTSPPSSSSSGVGSPSQGGLEYLGSSSTGEPPEWPSKVINKAKGHCKKTREVRQRFGLPSNEQVVQTYHCSVRRELISHGGDMFITQNYVCFYSGFPFHQTEKICFRNVVALERAKNSAGLTNCIEIAIDDGKLGERRVFFSGFVKTTEALTVLSFLWHNPPSYIQLDDDDLFQSTGYVPGASSASRTAGMFTPYSPGILSPSSSSSSSSSSTADGWGAYTNSTPSDWDTAAQSTTEKVKVDTATSALALRTALETRDMGVDLLQEFARQGEVIDRIGHEVENIHANLDKGDRILRGLETFGGGLKNTFTRDTTRKNNPTFSRMQRTIHLKNRVPQIVDVTILLKHSDDSLTPYVLRFTEETFEVFDSEKQATVKGFSWQYKTIEQIVLRARPLHIDVRFGKDTPRFRMMASACQAITNELFLRSIGQRHEPEVIFEPNIPPFEYGSYKLSLVPTKKKDNDQAPTNVYTAGTAQLVKAGKASDILSADIDLQTKEDFDLQARHIDGILDVANDLKSVALAMGEEIDRSAADLDQIAGRTGQAVHRVHHSNFRVKKML